MWLFGNKSVETRESKTAVEEPPDDYPVTLAQLWQYKEETPRRADRRFREAINAELLDLQSRQDACVTDQQKLDVQEQIRLRRDQLDMVPDDNTSLLDIDGFLVHVYYHVNKALRRLSVGQPVYVLEDLKYVRGTLDRPLRPMDLWVTPGFNVPTVPRPPTPPISEIKIGDTFWAKHPSKYVFGKVRVLYVCLGEDRVHVLFEDNDDQYTNFIPCKELYCIRVGEKWTLNDKVGYMSCDYFHSFAPKRMYWPLTLGHLNAEQTLELSTATGY